MGSFSLVHWGILLVVIVIVFGTSKLKNAGKDLGGAVKGFKDAVKDEEEAHGNKHRVLDHDEQPTNVEGNNVEGTRVKGNNVEGTRVDDVTIKSSTDEQHKS